MFWNNALTMDRIAQRDCNHNTE